MYIIYHRSKNSIPHVYPKKQMAFLRFPGVPRFWGSPKSCEPRRPAWPPDVPMKKSMERWRDFHRKISHKVIMSIEIIAGWWFEPL